MDQHPPMKILVAYDASPHADRMLDELIVRLGWFREVPTITVAFVHVPLPYPGALSVVGKDAVEKYYRDECKAVLDGARVLLEERHVPHDTVALVGEPASTLVETARSGRFDLIAMGTHGRGNVMNVVMGSIATKVLAATALPVLLFH
jgi:nucleotide-binding universal stress UspA family protein